MFTKGLPSPKHNYFFSLRKALGEGVQGVVVVLDVDSAPGGQCSLKGDGGVAGAWRKGLGADIGDTGRDDRLGTRTPRRVAEQRGLILAVQHAVVCGICGIGSVDGEEQQIAAIGKGKLADTRDR